MRFLIRRPPPNATNNALIIGAPTAAWQLKPCARSFKGLLPLVELPLEVTDEELELLEEMMVEDEGFELLEELEEELEELLSLGF